LSGAEKRSQKGGYGQKEKATRRSDCKGQGGGTTKKEREGSKYYSKKCVRKPSGIRVRVSVTRGNLRTQWLGKG